MASTLHEVFTQHNAALSFTAKDDANPSWAQICIILSTLGIADRHLMSSINCPEHSLDTQFHISPYCKR